MSLLLCRQLAKQPFYYDKLNIRIWSEQELSYLIYNYPLLVTDGFVTERLISWISANLQLTGLAEKLKNMARESDSVENMLLAILLACNYYSTDEIKAYRNRVIEIGRLPREYLLHETGVMLFYAGRLRAAYEKFEESMKELDCSMKHVYDLKEKEVVLRKKADYYCDMAVVRMRLLDKKDALRLLEISDSIYATKRAKKYRYLITGDAELNDSEKNELEQLKKRANEAVPQSPLYKSLEDLFRKDSVRIGREAAAIIKEWKKDYRRIN